MDSTKFYMWVSNVDHNSNTIWAEGYLIEKNGLSDYKYELEIDMDYLKNTLNEEDFYEIIDTGNYKGFFLGHKFYLEQFHDEEKEDIITLYKDERTQKEIEKNKKSRDKWVDKMMKSFNWK